MLLSAVSPKHLDISNSSRLNREHLFSGLSRDALNAVEHEVISVFFSGMLQILVLFKCILPPRGLRTLENLFLMLLVE